MRLRVRVRVRVRGRVMHWMNSLPTVPSVGDMQSFLLRLGVGLGSGLG